MVCENNDRQRRNLISLPFTKPNSLSPPRHDVFSGPAHPPKQDYYKKREEKK